MLVNFGEIETACYHIALRFLSVALSQSLIAGRELQCLSFCAAVGGHEALQHSNIVFQLRLYSLGITGFELDPHYCQLPIAEEVQPDRNSYSAVLTVVWIVLDSNCTRQTSNSLSINRTAFF